MNGKDDQKAFRIVSEECGVHKARSPAQGPVMQRCSECMAI